MESKQFIQAIEENTKELQNNIIRLDILNNLQIKRYEEMLSIINGMVGDNI